MPQPNRRPWAKLRSHSVRARGIDKLLNALRALDRAVVEISMEMYKVPRRDRAAMLEQHRLMHDIVRERISISGNLIAFAPHNRTQGILSVIR